MRKLLAAVALACCTLPVHAEILTFEFSGPITDIAHGDFRGQETSVSSTTLTPIPVALGTMFSGRFQFDTKRSTVAYYYNTASYVGQEGTIQPSKVSLDDGKWAQSALKGMHWIDVTNGTAGSPDGLLARTLVDDYSELRLQLSDPTGTAFSGKGLPRTLDLADFSEHYGQLLMPVSAGEHGVSYLSLTANLTSLSLVSAVPEPGSYAMLLAGLAVVGTAYRRRGRGKTLSAT